MSDAAKAMGMTGTVASVVRHGTAPAPAALDARRPHDHVVHFYETDDELVGNVARFLGAGLAAGEPVIVIATPSHRDAFYERLGALGVDVPFARSVGQLTVLDARETLERFMVDGMPDADKFSGLLGTVIQMRLDGRQDHKARAYGEMVDLLWRDGNRQAALRLEELWNDLAKRHAFSLLCAYTMGNFYRASDRDAFHQVCGVHTHVLAVDGQLSVTATEDRFHSVSLLQQRARSLENEIVHRKELEAALRESLAREQALREQAERHVHFADMFSGMLGHDLRNPLGTITMGANFISRLNPDEKTARAATRITNSAERMAKMIDQLLDFTRIRAAGGLKLNRVRVDLGHVCERVKEELEASNPACRIALRVAGDSSGLWDCDRLLQVFSNLIGNAVAHGTTGAEITIEADGNDASDVIASVRNAGVIADEVLPLIFDPFRGGAKRRNTNGLGLGLFISRQIVLAHGGAISVTSTTAAGTAIDVRIPRSPPLAAEVDTIAV